MRHIVNTNNQPIAIQLSQILANRKLVYSDEWIFERMICHIWRIGALIMLPKRGRTTIFI